MGLCLLGVCDKGLETFPFTTLREWHFNFFLFCDKFYFSPPPFVPQGFCVSRSMLKSHLVTVPSTHSHCKFLLTSTKTVSPMVSHPFFFPPFSLHLWHILASCTLLLCELSSVHWGCAEMLPLPKPFSNLKQINPSLSDAMPMYHNLSDVFIFQTNGRH